MVNIVVRGPKLVYLVPNIFYYSVNESIVARYSDVMHDIFCSKAIPVAVDKSKSSRAYKQRVKISCYRTKNDLAGSLRCAVQSRTVFSLCLSIFHK